MKTVLITFRCFADFTFHYYGQSRFDCLRVRDLIVYIDDYAFHKNKKANKTRHPSRRGALFVCRAVMVAAGCARRSARKMKTLMISTLILLGAFWWFYASTIPTVMRTRAMSDAMQLESNLRSWADKKVLEGKLDQSDLQYLFPEGYSLRFGGEHSSKNFREMIDHIAVSSAPPVWPGWIMIAVGILGGIHSIYYAQIKNPAEQAATRNR